MNNRTVNSKLICALTALLVLGNSIIFLPLKGSVSGCLLGLVLSFAIGFLIPFLFNNFDPTVFFHSGMGKVMGIIICLFSLICAASVASDFALVANKKILSDENYFLFSLIFSPLVFLILKAKKKVVFKISFIFLTLICFSQGILFLMSANQFNLSNFKNLNFSGTLSSLVSFFATCITPLFFLPFILGKEKNAPKGVFWGMIFGFILILLPLLQIALIFGSPYSESLKFPYISVLDTVSLGLKFSRLEGLSYIIFFFGALIKSSVCLMCAKEILSNLFRKTEKHIPFILSCFLFAVSIFSPLVSKARGFINAVLCVFAFVFTLTLALLKSRTHFRCKTR